MECALNSELKTLLEDPGIHDLCFNDHQTLFLNRGAGFERFHFSSPLFRDEYDYRNFILDHLSKNGKTWDAKLPFVDAVFFQTHRAHIAFPPLSRHGITLSLRKLPQPSEVSRETLQKKSIQRWNASGVAFARLVEAITKKETILISGATGSGKTTLLNDLISFIPEQERVITLEDTPELNPHHDHWVSLLTRTPNADGVGQVTLRDLVRQTLRMKPERILIGECRGDEVLDLLQSLNTGHRGTLTTLHANSPRDALKRLELLTLLAARGTLSGNLTRELIAGGIQKVVHLESLMITSLVQIEGFERDQIYTREIHGLRVS